MSRNLYPSSLGPTRSEPVAESGPVKGGDTPRPAPTAAHRVDMPCEAAGFDEPPCRLSLRLERHGKQWSLWAQSPPGWPERVARWLQRYAPGTIQIEPGLSPSILRADFADLPAAWRGILEEIQVQCIELTPEGTASLFTDDPLPKVRWFLDHRRHVDEIQMRSAGVADAWKDLTPRQRDALAVAVALGYYEVPRRSSLRAVADRLGMSVGAASELVRRGERLIITGAFDAMAAATWSDETDRFDQ